MIGRGSPEERSLGKIDSTKAPQSDPPKDLAVQWGVGCLVGAVALIGVVLLSALIAFALQPPAWVQIVVGIVLTLGGAVLTWLVATAWGRARAEQDRT